MSQLFYTSDKLKSLCLCSRLYSQQVYFEKLDFSLLATKSLFPKHFPKDNSNSKKSRERLSSPTIIAEDQTKRGEDKEIQNIKNKDIEIKVSTSRKKQNPKEILLEIVTICFRGLKKYNYKCQKNQTSNKKLSLSKSEKLPV